MLSLEKRRRNNQKHENKQRHTTHNGMRLVTDFDEIFQSLSNVLCGAS